MNSQATLTREVSDTGFTLTLERNFAYPPEKVYDAWTRPDALSQWMGPEAMTCADAEADARPGGSFRFPLVNPEGATHVAYGRYLEVNPPRQLIFTWAWEVGPDTPEGYEMQITLDFIAQNSGTRMILTQQGLRSAEARDQHSRGWSSSFDSLDRHLSH